MTINQTGDLFRSLQLRRDTTRLRTDLTKLTNELSSGIRSDISRVLKGDFSNLAHIESGLNRLSGFKTVIAEHRFQTSTTQVSLENLRAFGNHSGSLLALPEISDATLATSAGADAMSRFEAAVRQLNVQAAGRSIFSGTASDQPALADAETIMTAIEAEIASTGATTANDIQAIVSTWFGSGGSFETIGYTGGPAASVDTVLNDSEAAPPNFTAQEPEIREFLQAITLGALVGRDALSGNSAEQHALLQKSGEALIAADKSLVELQSKVGLIEAQIDRASVEVDSERDALMTARSQLIETDPFEAAVKLQQTEIQLESIYSVTARLSRLSIVGYLQ